MKNREGISNWCQDRNNIPLDLSRHIARVYRPVPDLWRVVGNENRMKAAIYARVSNP